MRKIVALLVCIFCASLTWGQYSTTYQTGITDIASYCTGTTNCWRALPTQTFTQPSLGADGSLYFLDASGCPWLYDLVARTYTKKTAMGCGLSSLSVGGASYISAIANDTVCGPSQPDVQNWNPSNNTWVHAGFCGAVTKVSAANDGGQAVIRSDKSLWTNLAPGWSKVNNGPWRYVSMASADNILGVSDTDGSIKLSSDGGNTFDALTSQPAGSTVGCSLAPVDQYIVCWFADNTAKMYDGGTGTWATASGTIKSATAASKAAIVALDTGNHPTHWNVYAGYVSGTVGGSWQGCPFPNMHCSTNVYHDFTFRVKLPGGLAGATGTQHILNTSSANTFSMDFAPNCDPLYGDPHDLNCQAQATGSILCEASGANLEFSPGSGQAPPTPPPIPGPHWSEYVGSFNGDTPTLNWVRQLGPQTFMASVTCRAWVNTCGIIPVPTHAVCAPPLISGLVKEGGLVSGGGASLNAAVDAARIGCAKHSTVIRSPGAWGIFSNYSITNGVTTCDSITPWDAVPFVTPCY